MSISIPSLLARWGRLLFQKMGLPWFLILVGLGPLCASLFLCLEKQHVIELAEQRAQIMDKTSTAFERKHRKELFVQKHITSDPYFLDQEIESFVFLQNEKNRLSHWLLHPAIARKETITNRLRFLESEDNRLSFVEDNIQTSKVCKETIEKQRAPVEIDCDDLNQFLSLIEDLPGNDHFNNKRKPQLLIYNFSLLKKKTILQNDVFEMKLDLLKREFLSP